MPLGHFVNRHYSNYCDDNVYLNPYTIIYDRFESQDLIKLKIDLYNDLEITVSFRENDKFKEILLKVKPQELKLIVRDREGTLKRTLMISSDIDYKEMEDSVKITFNKLEIIK